MSALSQCRTLAGAKAFTGIRPRQVNRISNGCKVFMRRKDSYMVEVNLDEEEAEDVAVRRFMKAVFESKVIEQLRARKHKESKIEAYKRRLRERHEIRKLIQAGLGGIEPTWEDINGIDNSPKVFDEFFAMDPDGQFGTPMGTDDGFMGGYTDSMWGGYTDGGAGAGSMGRNYDQGGYMDQAAPAAAGGTFPDQGGYMNTQAAPGQATSFESGYDSKGNFVLGTAPPQ